MKTKTDLTSLSERNATLPKSGIPNSYVKGQIVQKPWAPALHFFGAKTKDESIN